MKDTRIIASLKAYVTKFTICSIALVVITHAPASAVSANASLQAQLDEKNKLTASLSVELDGQIDAAQKALNSLSESTSLSGEMKMQMKAQFEQALTTLKGLKSQIPALANSTSASSIDSATSLAAQVEIQGNNQSILKSEISVEIQRRLDVLQSTDKELSSSSGLSQDVVKLAKERIDEVKKKHEGMKRNLGNASTDSQVKTIATELNASYDGFNSVNSQANLLVDAGAQMKTQEGFQSLSGDLQTRLEGIISQAKTEGGDKPLNSINGFSDLLNKTGGCSGLNLSIGGNIQDAIKGVNGASNESQNDTANESSNSSESDTCKLNGAMSMQGNAEQVLGGMYTIDDLITAIIEIITSVIALITSILKGDVEGAIASAKQIITTIFNQLQQVFESIGSVDNELSQAFEATSILGKASSLSES